MATPAFLDLGVPGHNSNHHFTEVISQQMRVPNRLSVGTVEAGEGEGRKDEDPHLVYRMHVPDRLSLAEAPDMSPRPLFTKQSRCVHQGAAWDVEAAQSPLRRSFSDQSFGRSPPVTPSYTKQALHAPLRSTGKPPSYAAPLHPPETPPITPSSLTTPQNVLQAVRYLSHVASQRVLQTVTRKYSSRFSFGGAVPVASVEMTSSGDHSQRSGVQEWLNGEDESAGSVEFLVLRRQVLKMSRRLAMLERQNSKHRRTEVLLFSLLLSACLVNGWLWLRR